MLASQPWPFWWLPCEQALRLSLMPVLSNSENSSLKLSGWGRYPVLDCEVEEPARLEELLDAIERPGTLIARGNGRSYGDAALNRDLTLSTLAMNRFHAFDRSTGLLTCEAGVLLSDILAAFTPRGWYPPVVPGTKFVTVGGMIAADVHGKSHQYDGSFGAHVDSLTLASGGEIRLCSRTENPRLFRATLGGMGLTGVIVSASFWLRRIETAYVREECLATSSLDETMSILEESRSWPFSVAWVDCLAKGIMCGRALISRATPMARGSLPSGLAAEPLKAPNERSVTVFTDAPSGLLNRASVGLVNRLHYGHGRFRVGSRTTHLDRFLYPLDRIKAWNRLYGRRGFVQYQCVVPQSESGAAIPLLLQRVAATGPNSFLGVLKQFGPQGDGLMSFPMEGHSLALDFPTSPSLPELLEALDEITHAHGGRIYLAKDSRCAPHRISEGYPQIGDFTDVRAEAAGVPSKFSSALSQRLSL